MSIAEIIFIISISISFFVIILSSRRYIKNRKRYVPLFCQNIRYLSNKTIDLYFNQGYYFPLKNFIIRIIIWVIILLILNVSMDLCIFNHWVTYNVGSIMLITFASILNLIIILAVRYDYVSYKKFRNKVNSSSIDINGFKQFINKLKQYDINSKLVVNKINKLSNKQYDNGSKCLIDALSLLVTLAYFTNFKNHMLKSNDKNKTQEFINTINNYYSSI